MIGLLPPGEFHTFFSGTVGVSVGLLGLMLPIFVSAARSEPYIPDEHSPAYLLSPVLGAAAAACGAKVRLYARGRAERNFVSGLAGPGQLERLVQQFNAQTLDAHERAWTIQQFRLLRDRHPDVPGRAIAEAVARLGSGAFIPLHPNWVGWYGDALASLARDRYCSWEDAVQAMVHVALQTARVPQQSVTDEWSAATGAALLDQMNRIHAASNGALSSAAVNRCKLALLGVARLATPEVLARVHADGIEALAPAARGVPRSTFPGLRPRPATASRRPP